MSHCDLETVSDDYLCQRLNFHEDIPHLGEIRKMRNYFLYQALITLREGSTSLHWLYQALFRAGRDDACSSHDQANLHMKHINQK